MAIGLKRNKGVREEENGFYIRKLETRTQVLGGTPEYGSTWECWRKVPLSGASRRAVSLNLEALEMLEHLGHLGHLGCFRHLGCSRHSSAHVIHGSMDKYFIECN